MGRRKFGQGVLLAILLFSAVVFFLWLAQSGRAGDKLCAPALSELKSLIDFQKWLGCALAMHENLAGGLIGGGGAIFAAWIAWHAVMRQINAEADQAYDALRVEVETIVDMLNIYWRIVDASIKNREWRGNGLTLLQSLHPRPGELPRSITPDYAKRLDPVRRRQFRKLM